MKEIPLVQLVTESLELCSNQFPCESGLRWKIRPRSHFPSGVQWQWWNQRHAGRPAGEMLQDENGEVYCLVEIHQYNGCAPWYIWDERVRHILRHGTDHPETSTYGGFYREVQG